MYNVVIKLQIYIGMKIDEIFASIWNDINYENKTINVNKTVLYINKEYKVLQKPIIVIVNLVWIILHMNY